MRIGCWDFEWPWIKKSVALDRERAAVNFARNDTRRQIEDERKQLQRIMKRLVDCSERGISCGDEEYRITVRLSASLFMHAYDRNDQRYLAEYIGREVEAECATALFKRVR